MPNTLQLGAYNVHLGNLSEGLTAFLKERNASRVFILTDSNTRKLCLPVLLEKAPELRSAVVLKIPAGEETKNIMTCREVWQSLIDNLADRNALVLNLGGGVVGDLGGFVAATFKRGIPFVQIPTSLLAQVDASIGGKLGVDLAHIKNMVGLFRTPAAVFIDPDFLETLPKRQLRNGFAEMIKHALIHSADDFTLIQQMKELNKSVLEERLLPSIKIKAEIVESDYTEKGIRKALNFGHTVGHALETMALEKGQELMHGEAIAAGMIIETWLSTAKLGFPLEKQQQIANYLIDIYGKIEVLDIEFQTLLSYMQQDKKSVAGEYNFTLLEDVGHAKIDQSCTEEEIIQALDHYRKLQVYANIEN